MIDLHRRRSDNSFNDVDSTILPLSATEVSDPAQRRHLDLLNQHIARTQELAAANAEIIRLTNLAYFDGLTGLANQRLLETTFDAAMQKKGRAQENGHDENVVIVFIDLNKFKQINDTYGHDVGDEALKLAARTLASVTRSTDVIAHIHEHGDVSNDNLPVRFAGDEFIILFTGASLDALQNKIALIKNSFSHLTLKVGDVDVPVGASIGAYECQVGDSLKHCKKQADIAMYKDKEAGRDTPLSSFTRFASGYIMPQTASVVPSFGNNPFQVASRKIEPQ